MKLNNLSDWEKPDAILNDAGEVLCPHCLKNLARVSKYGMIRKCKECRGVKTESFAYSFEDSNGFKFIN